MYASFAGYMDTQQEVGEGIPQWPVLQKKMKTQTQNRKLKSTDCQKPKRVAPKCRTKPAGYPGTVNSSSDVEAFGRAGFSMAEQRAVEAQHQQVPWAQPQLITWAQPQQVPWEQPQQVLWVQPQQVHWQQPQMSWAQPQQIPWAEPQQIHWAQPQQVPWEQQQQVPWEYRF